MMETQNRLRISLIIPTYNRAHLLSGAVDSALAQTRLPDEIIVVDDGSSDQTAQVLQNYGEQIIVLHKPNGGLASARNAGIERSSGDALAFLDDDDTLTPDSIAVRAALLEQHPAYGVVYGDVMLTDGEGREIALHSVHSGLHAPSGPVFDHYILHNLRPVHTYLIRRECLNRAGYFDPAYYGMEDYDLWLRIAAHCTFYYVPHNLGTYRFHGNQMTSTALRRMRQAELQVRERAFAMPAFAALPAAIRALAYSVQGTQAALLGDVTQARRWYRQAIATHPTNPRHYALLALTLFGSRGTDAVRGVYHRVRNFRTLRRS